MTEETTKPTPERLAKAGDDIVQEVHENRIVLRMKDSPLDRLAFGAKPKITGDQYNAGVRYYADAYKAGMMPSGVIDPSKERVDGGQHKDIADAKIAAQTRFEHALRALGFVDLNVLDAMVIQEVPLGEYAERFTRHKKRIIRQGIALELLCHALDALDKHYNPPRRDRGIAGAHSDGYRPTISGRS